jgi:hypothetical protein
MNVPPSQPMQQALEAVERVRLVAYTPLFDQAGKFVRWLDIGAGAVDDHGGAWAQIDMMPVNRDDFTGYIRLSSNGAPPPPIEDEPIAALMKDLAHFHKPRAKR